MRWIVFLAAGCTLCAQTPVELLDASKTLLQHDPAAALDFAVAAAQSNAPTERWFWPVMLEAQVKLGRWAAAMETGAKSVASIESGMMFTRFDQITDEVKLRRLYASALQRSGKPDDARRQLDIAAALDGENAGTARAGAIVAAERAFRLKYAKADLLATEIKQPAQPLPLKDLKGREVALADLRGKIVIVQFWATWCAPCVQELHELNAIYSRLHEPAEVLAIDIDDSVGVVAEFATKKGYAFQVVRSDGPAEAGYAAALSLQGPNIPQLYVIDRKGNIRFHISGFDDDGLFEEKLNWMIEAASK